MATTAFPTLLAHTLAERGLTYPRFKDLFQRTARELGLAGLTVSERTYRRWVSGEIVRPVNAALVVLAHLFPDVRPIERLFDEVGADGKLLHARPADPERMEEQALRDALATLGRRARQRSWQAVINEAQRESAIADEARATAIRIFQPLVVPAMLQTPDYARAVYEAARPSLSSRAIEAGVEDRTARQDILSREEPPYLFVVLSEAVLDWPIGGPASHRAQLQHLLEASQWRHVDLRVLPRTVGAHPSLDGGFQLFDLADSEPAVVYVMTTAGSLHVEDDQVPAYRLRFEALSALAVSPERSRILVQEAMSRLPEE